MIRTVLASALVLCLTTMSRMHAQIVIPSVNDINTIAGTGTAGSSGNNMAATQAELSNPRSVAVDAAGNVYIADYTNNLIRKVTASTGIIAIFAGGGSGCTGQTDTDGDGCSANNAILNSPEGVAVDTAGNI